AVAVTVCQAGRGGAAGLFSRRDRCELGGHKGWARIALASGVPVVPVSIVGSHAVNPVLASSELLAWLTLARPLFRIRIVPVTLAQVLAGGVAGAAGAALASPWAAA